MVLITCSITISSVIIKSSTTYYRLRSINTVLPDCNFLFKVLNISNYYFLYSTLVTAVQ